MLILALNPIMSGELGPVERTLFPDNQTGRTLRHLSAASAVISSSLCMLAMARAPDIKPIYAIPFFITFWHHYINFLLLSGDIYTSGVLPNSPAQVRFKPLRLVANVLALVFLAVLWVLGATYNFKLYGVDEFYHWIQHYWYFTYAESELIGVPLAVIEGGILIAMAVYCYKLRKEADLGSDMRDFPEQSLEDG